MRCFSCQHDYRLTQPTATNSHAPRYIAVKVSNGYIWRLKTKLIATVSGPTAIGSLSSDAEPDYWSWAQKPPQVWNSWDRCRAGVRELICQCRRGLHYMAEKIRRMTYKEGFESRGHLGNDDGKIGVVLIGGRSCAKQSTPGNGSEIESRGFRFGVLFSVHSNAGSAPCGMPVACGVSGRESSATTCTVTPSRSQRPPINRSFCVASRCFRSQNRCCGRWPLATRAKGG